MLQNDVDLNTAFCDGHDNAQGQDLDRLHQLLKTTKKSFKLTACFHCYFFVLKASISFRNKHVNTREKAKAY